MGGRNFIVRKHPKNKPCFKIIYDIIVGKLNHKLINTTSYKLLTGNPINFCE